MLRAVAFIAALLTCGVAQAQVPYWSYGLVAFGGGGGGISPPAGQIGGTAGSPTVLGIRETSGPTLLTTGTINDGECLKRSGTALISAVCGAGGSGNIDVYHFQAESLDPVDANWPAGNVPAVITDSVGPETTVQARKYLGASLTASGGKLTISSGTTQCKFSFVYQASAANGGTNNKVRWKLSIKALGTSGAMTTTYTFADQTVANNTNYALFTDTETHATTGLAASSIYLFELARVTSGVTNGMTQDAYLSEWDVACN